MKDVKDDDAALDDSTPYNSSDVFRENRKPRCTCCCHYEALIMRERRRVCYTFANYHRRSRWNYSGTCPCQSHLFSGGDWMAS